MKAPVKAALAAVVVVGASIVSMSLLATGRKEVLDAADAPRVVPPEVPAERASSPPPKGRSTAPAKELRAREEKPSATPETPRPGASAAPLPASLTVTAVDDSTTPIEGIPVILAGERGLVSSVTGANGEASSLVAVLLNRMNPGWMNPKTAMCRRSSNRPRAPNATFSVWPP